MNKLRVLLVLALLTGGMLLGGCREAGRTIIRWFTPKYTAQEGAEAAPVYDSMDAQRPRIELRLVPIGSGMDKITDLQFLPGRSDRLLVLEKDGGLLFCQIPCGQPVVVAKIPVLTESEQGLLGLAFHPQYAQNGLMYLNVVQSVRGTDHTRVLEYRVKHPANPPAGIELKRVVLELAQPYQNHNAGQLAFGPDGMLYVGFGDGGLADDPGDHGQNPATWLGSMLRIQITPSGSPAYVVPKDNPFIGKAGFAPETFAFGLRNPWRYSFDSRGRLIVADVGQNKWEEISVVEAGGNYGWKVREGQHCFKEHKRCAETVFKSPVHEYGRVEGLSITGGFEAYGRKAPELRGKYVFGDFVSGRMWALDLPRDAQGKAKVYALGRRSMLISTFGRDANGDIYVADYGRGVVYRLEE